MKAQIKLDRAQLIDRQQATYLDKVNNNHRIERKRTAHMEYRSQIAGSYGGRSGQNLSKAKAQIQ
jgi:hypothetical protein